MNHAAQKSTDRVLYKAAIRYALENQENLSLFQQAVEDLIIEDDVVKGVKTQMGLKSIVRPSSLGGVPVFNRPTPKS
jgi:tRNA U34 5-carboxymethylaminomethyl modifying enzyme MnmG/GidA